MPKKEQIRKIVEMEKKGRISIDQMIELLENLGKNNWKEDFEEISEYISKMGRSVTEEVMGRFTEKLGRIIDISSDERDNNINMSKVESPYGDNFEFFDNKIALSSLSNVELNDSHFSNVTMNAASLRNISMMKALFRNCNIMGSSIDELSLKESQIENSSFSATKLGLLCLLDDSLIKESVFNGTSVRGVKLEEQTSLLGIKINGLGLTDSIFTKCDLQAITVKGCLIDSLRVMNTSFKNCTIQDVILKNVEIRNVTIEDKRLSHISLKDLEINGNEEFLRHFCT